MIKNPKLDKPRLYVDFNEMLEDDLVLLSQHDSKIDSSGANIHLYEGQPVYIFMDDVDEEFKEDNLLAQGIVEITPRNSWSKNAKWCCRINSKGIARQSDIEKSIIRKSK